MYNILILIFFFHYLTTYIYFDHFKLSMCTKKRIIKAFEKNHRKNHPIRCTQKNSMLSDCRRTAAACGGWSRADKKCLTFRPQRAVAIITVSPERYGPQYVRLPVICVPERTQAIHIFEKQMLLNKTSSTVN